MLNHTVENNTAHMEEKKNPNRKSKIMKYYDLISEEKIRNTAHIFDGKFFFLSFFLQCAQEVFVHRHALFACITLTVHSTPEAAENDSVSNT